MNKQQMINFLSGHFRYNTMNSWNASTSYAMNIKIHHVNFPDKETEGKAWEMINLPQAFWDFDKILRDFAERYRYEWQIGRNGRSSGYLVLYQGYMKKSEYKRYCQDCGQRNFRADTTECGKCGSKNMEDYEGIETGIWGGKSTDQGEGFSDWDFDTLRKRVRLVKDFDKTCDKAVKAFIKFCQTHHVKEKTVMVPKKVMVAVKD